jgi:23S rRNA (cytidine1920-2'-O)/16S rRNA (cytidine1409-2'-O)-methyltransferase
VTAPSSKAPRQRLDLVMVEQGKAESRARAQALIMAGRVSVAGRRVDKPGTLVAVDATVEVADRGAMFVSRGGEKLAGALQAFASHGLTVVGKTAADFGSSTGGFVDCLLQHGAVRVHAIDVGQGLLHEKLRADPRVVVHERTNARFVDAAALGETVDMVVVDASFIGLGKLLAAVVRVLGAGGELVALVKPQFEAGRREVSRGRGVIRDERTRARVVQEVIARMVDAGFEVVADAPCVVLGPKGNQEHFVFARLRSKGDVG